MKSKNLLAVLGLLFTVGMAGSACSSATEPEVSRAEATEAQALQNQPNEGGDKESKEQGRRR